MADGRSDEAWDGDDPLDDGSDGDESWNPNDVGDGEPSSDVTTLLFTASNPRGTVFVTSLMEGRPIRVELDPGVASMTERQLADEITVIAELSRQQARAGQHALVAHVMQGLGHDPAGTRGFLERDVGLPSPETVRTERAQLFASRYSSDDDR